MPGTFKSISIFAYDLDHRGNPVQVWETVVDESEEDAIAHAKTLEAHHAGALVVNREGRPAVSEEGDPIIIFQSGKIATSTEAISQRLKYRMICARDL
jgi:hypothetical protein